MSGRTILSKRERTTGASSGSSRSSTRPAGRSCAPLALTVARQLKHEDVLAALAELFIARGPPAHIRSDNGSEFIATAVQKWLGQVGVRTLYIAPGSPWENGYNESSTVRFATSCSTARSSAASPRQGC